MSDVAPAGIMMMGVRDSGKKDNTTKELDPQTTLQEDLNFVKI